MARVTYGSTVDNLAGSIGGVTFQNTKSGPIMKLKPKHRSNNSAASKIYQNELSNLVLLWKNLDLELKLEWDAFAAAIKFVHESGKEYYISGYNYFISVNRYLSLLGLSYTEEPLSAVAPDALPEISITMSSIKPEIVLGSSYAGEYNYLIIYSTPPVYRPASIQLPRYIFTGAFQPGEPLSYSLLNSWNAAHNLDYASIIEIENFYIGLKVLGFSSHTGTVTAASYCIGTRES